MVTKIYLIRHCQSMGNVQHRFQGRFDAEVSPDGAKQLELLGLRFRNQPIDAIYTSPLQRARATAEAIARYHPELEVKEEPGLIEIDCGDMENLLLAEVAERFPRWPGTGTRARTYASFRAGRTWPRSMRGLTGLWTGLLRRTRGKR